MRKPPVKKFGAYCSVEWVQGGSEVCVLVPTFPIWYLSHWATPSLPLMRGSWTRGAWPRKRDEQLSGLHTPLAPWFGAAFQSSWASVSSKVLAILLIIKTVCVKKVVLVEILYSNLHPWLTIYIHGVLMTSPHEPFAGLLLLSSIFWHLPYLHVQLNIVHILVFIFLRCFSVPKYNLNIYLTNTGFYLNSILYLINCEYLTMSININLQW